MSRKFLGTSISLDPILSFTTDETAESYIFRLTDLLNPNRSSKPLADVLSRAIILILLQCAARLVPNQQLSTQAYDLIGCNFFRDLLTIGFGAKFDQVSLRNALSLRVLEPTSAENWSQNCSLFAAYPKVEANLLWGNGNLLCILRRIHNTYRALLQNSCVPPRTDELFMFHNYTDLVARLSLSDKAALVTLLPDLFHWSGEKAYNDSTTSTMPERTLLAQPPMESQSTDLPTNWLQSFGFASEIVSPPSTYADSSIDNPSTARSKSNAERLGSDPYQETLTRGIIREIMDSHAKNGIQPRCFGPPNRAEGNIGALAQDEARKLQTGKLDKLRK